MSNNTEFSILIADADNSDWQILRDMLDNKYELLFAETGKSAIETARDKRPDVILLNDTSDFDTLAEFKACGHMHSIPVILIIEEGATKYEERVFFLGGADYINKPFNPATVKARIKTQLEIVRQARRAERYALIDVLVDLPNKRSFDTNMETEWSRAIREKTPINLLMIDVDDFEKYNKTYGIEQSDSVLRTIANTILSTLKRKTDMVFCLGGDVFAAILPDTTLGGALRVAEDIRANVEAVEIQGGLPFVTVSVGIASASPGIESNMSEFLSAADNALRGAKEGGKDTVRAYTVI
jgi:diguanylate cyclase (GGDEF)-like protein